jgi:site-specific recombinase XerD
MQSKAGKMTTKSDRRSASNDDQKPVWTPPRGIRYLPERAGRPSPWLLEWREHGNRRVQAFTSEADRELAAKELVEKRGEYGREILTFDVREWRRWLDFKEALGAAIDPMVVLHEWKTFRQGSTVAQADMTVAQAVDAYMRLRLSEKISADTRGHIKTHVKSRFAGSHGAMKLRDVSAQVIRDWLAGVKSSRTGEPVDALTQRHHRKDLNTFLKRAVAEGWILRNPCESVVPPAIDDEDVTVLPIEHAVALFAANRNQPCVGRLALEAFGGLRYSSAARVQAEHIDTKAKGIAMPGALHKSGRRKYRQGQPPNLWAWIKHAPAECWTMTQRQYLKAKGEAFVRAGVPFPKNVLRHSFASYHLAMLKDQPRTAYLMQHTNTKMLEHYEGVATEADAKRFFAIKP